MQGLDEAQTLSFTQVSNVETFPLHLRPKTPFLEFLHTSGWLINELCYFSDFFMTSIRHYKIMRPKNIGFDT